jgi:hypothetical protein
MGFREKMKQLRRFRDGGVLNICNKGIAVAMGGRDEANLVQ